MYLHNTATHTFTLQNSIRGALSNSLYVLCTVIPLLASCAWRIDEVKCPLNIIMPTTINWNEAYFLY